MPIAQRGANFSTGKGGVAVWDAGNQDVLSLKCINASVKSRIKETHGCQSNRSPAMNSDEELRRNLASSATCTGPHRWLLSLYCLFRSWVGSSEVIYHFISTWSQYATCASDLVQTSDTAAQCMLVKEGLHFMFLIEKAEWDWVKIKSRTNLFLTNPSVKGVLSFELSLNTNTSIKPFHISWDNNRFMC